MAFDTIIKMKNISLEFPGVKALSNVDFSTESGIVHAIVGANGAGKSTLMKVLGGVETSWSGEILINDEPVSIRNPQDAKKLGIEVVYQEIDTALALNMSVAENIMLSSTIAHSGKQVFMRWKQLYKKAKRTLERLCISIDLHINAGELSLAEKQMVLIARAIVERCRVLVLDEPTAALSQNETQELFRIVNELTKHQNVAVIFISHRLQELFEICDKVSIMRDGCMVFKGMIHDLSLTKIVEEMLGRRFDEEYPKHEIFIGDEVLSVKNLTSERNEIHDVTLKLKKGEIIGIVGLVGAGKTELCKTLFGDLKISSGTVKLLGKNLYFRSPYDAVSQGIALVPEERRKEGILVDSPVYINLTAANLSNYCKVFKQFLNKKAEHNRSRQIIKDLGIKTPNDLRLVKFLSGGNQQKTAIGKWLLADAEIYIFDEPMKGIDVGAKRDVFELISQLADQGKCILYASCETQEILNITDRVYVMYNGTIVKELETNATTENEILYYSVGGSINE